MSISTRASNRMFSVGYVAKGIVYFLIGALTLGTALGFSSGVEGPKGIINFIENQPFGQILVGLLGLGLASYAIWRLYRAVADPTHEGHDPSSVVKRLAYAASGTVYVVLSVFAIRLALGFGGSSSGGQKQAMLARILAWPAGPWLVGLIALIILGVAGYQLYKGIKLTFLKSLTWQGVDRRHVKVSGRWGHAARSVVFAIISYFLALTALRTDPDNFRGTEGAIEYLQQNNYGIVLLALMGVGLMLYGYFGYLKGRYATLA